MDPGSSRTATFLGHAPLAPPPVAHHVYVLECADGTLYTGYTTDLERRVEEHDEGRGARYTRGRTPVELVHSESYDTRSAAMRREAEIKALRRRQKLELVAGGPAP